MFSGEVAEVLCRGCRSSLQKFWNLSGVRFRKHKMKCYTASRMVFSEMPRSVPPCLQCFTSDKPYY